jgi:hypothetical protein
VTEYITHKDSPQGYLLETTMFLGEQKDIAQTARRMYDCDVGLTRPRPTRLTSRISPAENIGKDTRIL